jgi:predicted nicotinamide N-methyase
MIGGGKGKAMARFPLIDSPCPYKGRLADIMDGDNCRLCERQVFDLTAWSDGERAAFLAGCAGQVCVTYRRPLRLAAAAMAAAAMAVPGAAAAQQSGAGQEMMVIVGGITDPRNASFVEDEAGAKADAAIPELPIVYEDEGGAPASGKG